MSRAAWTRRLAGPRKSKPRRFPVPQRIATSAQLVNGVLVLRIQKRLENLNPGNRNPHWSVKHREKTHWQALIANAIVDGLGMKLALQLLGPACGIPGARGRCDRRTRVQIVREVPTARQFVKDEFDNLRWATKELRDSLTKLGLIHDDSSKWCETEIRQDISPDEFAWTAVTISLLEGSAAAPRSGVRSELLRALGSFAGMDV